MDLLTAQCDRHAENIFVDQHGGLQFIDNDRALGVVTHCGADSVLLPGGRYHSKVRGGARTRPHVFTRVDWSERVLAHRQVQQHSASG